MARIRRSGSVAPVRVLIRGGTPFTSRRCSLPASVRPEVVLFENVHLDLVSGPVGVDDRPAENVGDTRRSLDMDALVTLLVILVGLALIDPIGLGMARTED